MLVATIDIGTNSTKLLIAKREDTGALISVVEDVQLTRLGEGSQKDKILKPTPIQRTLDALKEYKKKISSHSVEMITVAATMCTREAKNQKEFCQLVFKATGWNVRVLSGDEEAELAFRGARSLWHELPAPIAAIDIGGGSSEWILQSDAGLQTCSLAMGSVRETETFMPNQPPTQEQLRLAREHLQQTFEELSNRIPIPAKTNFIGIGGTVTTLEHMIHADLPPSWSDGSSEKRFLTIEELNQLITTIAPLKVSERLKFFPFLEQGRADVILAGALILHTAMKTFHLTTCLVSHRGLRFGLCP